MLLSANLKVPENIFVHFHIIIEGEKMSKTLGNVISPENFLEKYHYEAVRFYFAHQPVFKDWNFTWSEFENFYQGVLKKDLANLILRIFGILNKIESKEIKIINTDLDHSLEELENNFKTKMENLEFDAAYGNSLDFLHSINKFIDKNKIWETKKENDLSFLIKSLLLIIKLYAPLLPETISSLQEKIEIKDKIYLNNKIKLKPFYK
jgi:methionyl-tRNA synthetase